MKSIKTPILVATVLIMSSLLSSCSGEYDFVPNKTTGDIYARDRGTTIGDKTVEFDVIKKGLYGAESVEPGSTQQYSAQFFDGGNGSLNGGEQILWIMQGSIHEQSTFVHYFDCTINGDCDGFELDPVCPPGEDGCACQLDGCFEPEFWYEINNSTTVNIGFPINSTSDSFTITAAIVCGDECWGPAVSIDVDIN